MSGQSIDREAVRVAATDLYASHADEYAQRDQERWATPDDRTAVLREVVEDGRPRCVLEIGVGTGRYFPYLRGEQYVGVDVCSPMLSKAREREHLLRENGFTDITLVEDEALSYIEQLAPSHFDLVFSIGCVGLHIAPDPRFFRAVERLLSADGKLFLQTVQESPLRHIIRVAGRKMRRLLHREDRNAFYVATSRRRLSAAAMKGGLVVVWMKEEQKRWWGRPLLLTLFRRSG